MNTLAAGLALTHPSEVAFRGTVLDAPHLFFGRPTQSWHEAFHVRADDGSAVEIVDNVTIAPQIPVVPGDRIGVLGELVPETARGPLVHWTHHDPAGEHAAGYLELNGRRYA